LPSAFVHSVVEAPFGAHPTSSGGLYEADDAHLEEYVKASADAASFTEYLERYAGGAVTHRDYHKLIGSPHLREPAAGDARAQQ
jgi:glutaconate CoA-transferase subunit A